MAANGAQGSDQGGPTSSVPRQTLFTDRGEQGDRDGAGRHLDVPAAVAEAIVRPAPKKDAWRRLTI
jgi:hypothetical protein